MLALCISLPDSASGDPSLRIKSSSSTGSVFFFFTRQRTIPRPPKIMAPPTPTTTPMMTFFVAVERPPEPPLPPSLAERPAVGNTPTEVWTMVDFTFELLILVVTTLVMIAVLVFLLEVDRRVVGVESSVVGLGSSVVVFSVVGGASLVDEVVRDEVVREVGGVLVGGSRLEDGSTVDEGGSGESAV